MKIFERAVFNGYEIRQIGERFDLLCQGFYMLEHVGLMDIERWFNERGL